jgi:hypothetical protein
MARAVYSAAINPECSLPGGSLLTEIRAELRRFEVEPVQPMRLEELREQASAWSLAEARRYLALFEQVGTEDTREALMRRAALGCAPLALMSGAWLQWLSAPAHADDPAVLSVLALYAADVGVGHPRASRGSAYLALLRQLRLSEHAAPTTRLSLDERIADGAFVLPALLLTMSRRPDDFMPEILGADLCLRTIGPLPALAIVRQTLGTTVDWNAIDPGSARPPSVFKGVAQCQDVIDTLLARAGDDAGDIGERVNLGFAWALEELRAWSGELHAELDAARDPAFEMAELMRLRARVGAVYHHSFQLGDRPLSEWFKQAQTDPGPLLRVLAASRLVRRGRAEASPLVNSLVMERGAMFRVFSPDDLKVIRRWIDSLPAVEDTAVDASPSGQVLAHRVPPLDLPALVARPIDGGRTPGDIREAYYLLLTRADTPELRRFARDYVRGWLARSRHGMDRGELRLPAQWGPEGLRPWLVEQHDQHGREFEATAKVPVPSKKSLIDSTIQLAPLTLIDGSWLQGFTDYEHTSSEVGHSLFETYWDELGNGEVHLNHPLIYRKVLAEMGVQLPPTGSREFTLWPGFKDSSFELPVYWLSIGRFPQTFMPEVLGLNLAMELSGVGGTYRRARLALKTYGFSTRFVDIHNTIDNVASGHSAWAADAVDTYMASIPTAQGTQASAQAWDRVRTGYRSLNPPTDFLARQAGRRARRSGKDQ